MKRKPTQNSSLNWLAVKACIMMVAVLLCPGIALAGSDTGAYRRLAILSSKEIQESGLSDLLTVQLQELTDVELVERDMLQKVLDEVALSIMLGAEQSENRRKAGALLKADILVLLSVEDFEGEKNVRFVISDCAHGARLRVGWVLFDSGKLESTCRDLTKIVKDTLERFKGGVKQIIGVSHFISRNLIHDYDYLQASYAYLLENALSSLPGIAVIETEEARSIRLESELAGDMKIDRLVPLFAEGEFTVQSAVSEKRANVHITVRISDSAAIIKQIERKDLAVDKVARFITDDVAQEILKLSKSPSLQTLDKEKQFTALVNRASEFAMVGAWEHSTGLREAAVLLKPDSVEQRVELINEYYQIKEVAKKPRYSFEQDKYGIWRLSFEHLEYMIYNRMIDMGKATELSWKSFTGLPRSAKRDFLRTAYPEILKLEPFHSHPYRYRKDYGAWYENLIGHLGVGTPSFDDRCAEKEDLEIYLHIHNNFLPEKMEPGGMRFWQFMHSHIEPGWHKRPSDAHPDLYFAKHPEHITEQDFVDFLTALSRSKMPFWGRYALLYREYYVRQKQSEAMDDLLSKADSLISEIRKRKAHGDWGYPTEKLRQKIERYIEGKPLEAKKTSTERKDPKRSSRPEREPVPPAKGRLIFKGFPMKVKDLSGNIVHAAVANSLLSSTHRAMIRCGDSLDVMWSRRVVLFMREKGLLEEVFVSEREHKAYFDDVAWDGQNIWVGTRNRGIWLLDTSGKIMAKINSQSGLPPAEKRLRLCPIERGKILAVGSFGPHSRGWCAIVEYKKGKASVNVFHEATRLPIMADNESELEKDPEVAFVPLWIHKYQAKEKNERVFFVGRRIHSPPPGYTLKIRSYPLEIDLNKMTVAVSPHSLGSGTKMGSGSHFSSNGRLFACGSKYVICVSAPGTKLPSGETKQLICRKRGLAKYLLEYDGAIYVPGRTWFRFDPDTLEEEKLVYPVLPKPRSSLDHYWVSAHYGLIGWNFSRGFFQIRVVDEEQVYGYFHTFVFEDENGPITDWRILGGVRITVRRRGKYIVTYEHKDFKKGGWFVPGTYEPWWRQSSKFRKFEPIEVTEDSPEELVFRIKPEVNILYCGQVVDAITGKPMQGAFVMAGFESNLAWITSEEWDALHKLPTNPSRKDKALWPVKNTNFFGQGLKHIVRTDSNGRFEMRLKREDRFYEFAAFEENYLSTALLTSDLGSVKNAWVEMPPMSLFPAAKIFIEPRVSCYNVRLSFIPDRGYRSKRAATFFRMYGYSSGPYVSRPDVERNLRQPYYVPAGVSFKMEFSILSDDKCCIPDIPQTIRLKQGETLDLGRFVFDPAIQIILKVVDSAGDPVINLAITRSYDSRHHIEVYRTDENGEIPFYVEPNSQARFHIHYPKKKRRDYKTITCKIGGKEDEGKEFILQVSDDTVRHLSK